MPRSPGLSCDLLWTSPSGTSAQAKECQGPDAQSLGFSRV